MHSLLFEQTKTYLIMTYCDWQRASSLFWLSSTEMETMAAKTSNMDSNWYVPNYFGLVPSGTDVCDFFVLILGDFCQRIFLPWHITPLYVQVCLS